MRVVFMGSAEIACASLQTLLAMPSVEVVGMVSQPDRPAGRRQQTLACAAKAYAETLGIELYTPTNVNSPETLERLRAWRPDIGVVIAYGQILKRALLELPRLGCINIHTSLLPKYRGAAPIQWAVANGETETGVTIMQMDVGMDTGDILAQRTVLIGEQDTAGDVHDRLAVAGAALLPTVLADIQAGQSIRRPQNSALATMAPKLSKADGQLNWTQSARYLSHRIRGFNPWPGSFCHYEYAGALHTMRVLEAQVEECAGNLNAPGTIIGVGKVGPLVACGEGALRLRRVQPEGGNVMDGAAFLCGRSLLPGDRFQ